MKELQNKVNGYINLGICYSILTILLGIIILAFPNFFLTVGHWFVSISLVAGGLILIINDYRRRTIGSFLAGSILGIILIVLGIIIIAHPGIVGVLIPIVLGAYMIISSILSLRVSGALKSVSPSSFYLTLITSIIAIICGIILIVNPFEGIVALTIILGAAAIVYGIAGLADLIVLRGNIKEVAKYIKQNTKVVEGKVVEEKSSK